jgi:hypothetical protein
MRMDIKITLFWEVTPCRFGVTCCPVLDPSFSYIRTIIPRSDYTSALKMEAEYYSETLVPKWHPTTLYNIAEVSNI